MGTNNNFKKVYIFGNERIGFHGHTYYKEYADKISKNRKNLDMVKVKNNDYFKENLSVNTEFLKLDENIFMTADEEEYFIESFNQFTLDVIVYINDLLEEIKYFKFNKTEENYIHYLLRYLLDYKEYILHGQYEVDDEDEEHEEPFDTVAAMKWFVKNVLDYEN